MDLRRSYASRIHSLGLLLVAGLAGCPDTAAVEARKVSVDELSKIEVEPVDRLDALADALRDALLQGDLETVAKEWISPGELEGCEPTTTGTTLAQLDAKLVQAREEFSAKAPAHTTADKRDRSLFQRTSHKTPPQALKVKLGGEQCKATDFGRLRLIFETKVGDPEVIEHRFDALLVDGTWRVTRYQAVVPKCDASSSTEPPLACEVLLKHGRAARR